MQAWLILVLQSVLAVGACLALYRLWLRFAALGVAVPVVGVVFVGRALLSIGLFWISWLSLPFARSMQLGQGLWFFALDGRGYYQLADRLINDSLAGPLLPDRLMPASTWVQVLAIGRMLFGSPVSVAILINMACFLGSVTIVAVWGRRSGAVRSATLTILVLCFSPSLVLWTTQPLKDTFFIFLVVAFAFCCSRWLGSASDPSRHVLSIGACVVLTLHLIGGVRWYYGVILWSILCVVALWTIVFSSEGRRCRLRREMALFGGAAVAIALGAPGSILAKFAGLLRIPSWAGDVIRDSKRGFQIQYDASTVVDAGSALSGIPGATEVARGFMFFLPRSITSYLGLASAGGGRGLWVFADLDTLYFLAVVLVVVVLLWRARPLELKRRPMTLFLLLSLLAGLPMMYVVNNFGTLLRLRLLVLVPIALLPLTIHWPSPSTNGVSNGSGVKSDQYGE